MKIVFQSGDNFQSSQQGCLTRVLVLAMAVMLGAWLLPGVRVDSFWAVMATAFVISVLNNLVRPILVVITLPVTIVSMGLFIFVINALIVLMASGMVGGFKVDGLGWALLLSLIITGINYLLEWQVERSQRKDFVERHDTSDDTDDEGFTHYEEIND
ncbi:MAG: phage holin family protein [Bacteroidales bacterium]|nr:phage holin family protein [Bacteroidales bacterium]